MSTKATKPTIDPTVIRSKAFEADFKAESNDGTFSGYGSVFGVVDSYGEIVAPGAFEQSLKDLRRLKRTLPVLWQHQTGNPIGNWTALKEDDRGLAGDGELWLEDAPQAKIAYKGLRTRSITGLSIGYYVRAYEVSDLEDGGYQITLTDVNLVECSIVTSPANDEARVEAVKAKLARGEEPTLAEVEKILREAGFSRSRATAIVASGVKQSRSESEAPNPLLAALRGFNL